MHAPILYVYIHISNQAFLSFHHPLCIMAMDLYARSPFCLSIYLETLDKMSLTVLYKIFASGRVTRIPSLLAKTLSHEREVI